MARAIDTLRENVRLAGWLCRAWWLEARWAAMAVPLVLVEAFMRAEDFNASAAKIEAWYAPRCRALSEPSTERPPLDTTAAM